MRKTGEKIRSLFLDGPPPTPEEVRHVLSGVCQDEVREVLLQLIRENILAQHHFGLFVEIAKMVNIVSTHASELFEIAKSSMLPQMARQFAVVALTSSKSDVEVIRLFSELEPSLVIAASDMPFIDMLTAIQMDPSIASDLSLVLLDASPEEQEYMLLSHIGRIRREVGTPAVLAYRDALSEPALSHLHHHMIDAIVQERDANAAELLTTLRDNAPNENARKQFQLALLRMGTKQIEDMPGRNEPTACAYVTICDGQGAFFLVCRFQISEANSSTATCCIRASGEIRDAFMFPQHDDRDFEQLMQEMADERLAYAELPVGEAATLFRDALERTHRLDKKLPDSAAPVVALFERITPTALEALKSLDAEGDAEALKWLLEQDHYASWFFDKGDLHGNGIVPPVDDPVTSWCEFAADVLSRTPLKTRLVAMLEHMVRWHTWKGEDRAVSVCAGALDSVKKDFSASPVVRHMLTKSVVGDPGGVNGEPAEFVEEDEVYGDEILRTMLRRRFYAELKRPSGKHMAELDFTEVAYRHLLTAFSHLPGEKRPTEDDVLDIAHEIAVTVVQSMLKEREVGQMIRSIERRLSKRTDLTDAERREVVTSVVEGMFSFVDSACQGCPSHCLMTPRKGMANMFFSSKHPALT